MPQLDTFTGGDVDINTTERLVTITGGVVNINNALDPPTGFDDWGGWRILCTSHGRPSGTTGAPSTFTPTGYANEDIGNSNNAGEITLSATNYNLTDTGKRFTFTNLGGYSATGIAINTRYYIRKVGDNKIRFYASEANALNDVSPLAFTTNGTISTMRIQYDNGRGGFRSTSGASGTLGGGKHSLTIVETANGNLYDEDNYNKTTGHRRARFYGDGTNLLKYHNIVWIIEATTTRYDFDFYQGSDGDGSNGPKCELSGVDLIQLNGTNVPAAFNHFSSQSSIVIHPEVGYGLRIANYSNGHAIEFTHRIQDGAKVEGLVIRNVTAAHNNGATAARVTAQLNQVPANGEFVLSNLNSPSVSDVSGSSDKTFVLIDPVGQPTITDSWGRHTYLEIRRTVPFVFTGAEVPASPAVTLYAVAAVGGQDASAVVSGSSGTIQLRTQRTDNNTTLSWTDRNEYRFFMTSLGLRKYSLTTTQTIANDPATITAALTADTLPNGNAISSITAPTNNNPPDTLAEVLRAIKDVEVANPTTSGFPTTSLAYVEGNAVKIHDDYSLTLDSTASTLIEIATDPNGLGGQHIDLKTGTSLGNGSEGLTTIDASGTGETISTTSVTESGNTFLKDSTGQKSIVAVTNNLGAAARFAVVNTTDGTTLASATVNNGATGNLAIATKGLTTGYRLVSKRPGYNYYSAEVDLTGGGLKSFTAPPQAQIVQPDGSASYQSVTIPDTLTVAITNSGSTPKARIECGNATFSARQIFKAYEDEIATADGDKYMGLGGAQMTYTLSALKGNEIVLGTHTKVKRKASTDTNATIRASLYAPDDMPVDNDDGNGDVMTIEGLDVEAVAKAIVVDTDYDPSESGVQSIWSKLNEIESGGGGGSTLTAQQVWEYSGTRDLSTSPPTAAQVWGYSDRQLTTAPSSLTAAQVWGYTAGSGRTLTSAAGLTADQATQLSNASTKSDLINDKLSDGNNGLPAISTAVDAFTESMSKPPTVIYSAQDYIISPTAYDTSTNRFTVPAADYANLSYPNRHPRAIFTDLSTYTGFTLGTAYYIHTVGSNQIVLTTSPSSSSNPISLTGSGTITDVKIRTPQGSLVSTYNPVTGSAAVFETVPWELENKSSGHFKVDAGYTWGAYQTQNARTYSYGAALQVSYSDTKNGTYSSWQDIENMSSAIQLNLSNNKGFWAWSKTIEDSRFRNVVDVATFTGSYPLSLLPSAITDGKYVKFRMKYFRWASDNDIQRPDWIDRAYLNLTITPSLGIVQGADQAVSEPASGQPVVLYSYQPIYVDDIYPVYAAPTAIDIANDTITIDGDLYDDLSTADTIRIGSLGGYELTNENNTTYSGSLPRNFGIRKIDDTNHKIEIYDNLFRAENPDDYLALDISGTGTLSTFRWGDYFGPQSTANNAPSNFTTPVWKVSNFDDYYIKIDAGYQTDIEYSPNVFYSLTAKIEVSIENTANGAFNSWFDVPNATIFKRVGGTSADRGWVTIDGTRFYKLSSLSSINSGAITNDKFVKFRIKYVNPASSQVIFTHEIANAYLNITILPSLTVSGSTLNAQQNTWLSNVNTVISSATHGNAALKTAVDGVAGDVWEVDLSAAATDDTAADLLKDASTNSGGGGGGGFTSTDRTALTAIKTTTDALDVPTAAENATAVSGALTIPTAAQNAAAVWTVDLSGTQTADTSGDLLKDASTNSGGGGGGGFTSTDRTNLGAIKTVTDALDVPTAAENATAVWGATTKEITGGGFTSTDRTNLGSVKTSVEGIPTGSPPSASDIATEVWGEDLSGTASAGTAAALIKNASTSGFDSTDRTNLGSIKTSVEGIPTTAAPSKEDVATAVLNATLHEGQRAGVTFSPIAQAGDSFEVTTAIANQLRNGDRINFTANGGYTVLGDPVNPSVEFYIYKAYDSIFIYQTSANALIGNSQYLRLGNSGTATNVSITRPPDSRYITIQTALDGLFSNTGSTIHGIDAVLDKLDDIPADIWNVDLDPGTAGRQDIRSAIRNINGLLGTSFVETDIGVQEAFRIILAVLAGRSTATGTESKTITFHRVGDGTAIVRGTASESGRTAPIIDPT